MVEYPFIELEALGEEFCFCRRGGIGQIFLKMVFYDFNLLISSGEFIELSGIYLMQLFVQKHSKEPETDYSCEDVTPE